MDAIFEATLQVLLRDGTQRLTTTRVAERAGVSVGTLYQYYPNKQALLYGVLQRHLLRIGAAVEQAAQAMHHAPLASMTHAVIEAFVTAKTARIDEARALYRVASEVDSLELVKKVETRCVTAIADMLDTAADIRFADPKLTAFMLSAAMVGPTRAMLEGGAPPHMLEALPGELELLCLGYLTRVGSDEETA